MAGNVKHKSPMLQNGISGVASSLTVQQIAAKANESFVSVISDKLSDISGNEQFDSFELHKR